MVFFPFLILLFPLCSSDSSADLSALLNFKNQITNAENILDRNWTTGVSFCHWIGITCSPARERVTSLSLPNMNFLGTISPSVGNLSFLTRFDLSGNHLTGSIPPTIFTIPSLVYLNISNNSLSGSFLLNQEDTILEIESIDLSYNNLTGDLPSSLCRFVQLDTLSLSYNNLNGQIPRDIGCLSKLERLYMTDNKITGSIPPSLGNVSSLRLLGCVRNRIHGHIPRELGRLSNLQMLGFDFNNLTGEIPQEIFYLSSLVDIALTDNNLSGRLPATLGLHLPNLQGIYLADNLLEGPIPKYITNASRLKQLELSYNLFTGTIPGNLGNLRELVFLNLASNQLRNEPGNQELGFLNSLTECRMLEFLIVGNNPLSGTLPESIRNLSRSIQMFNIENAGLHGKIPEGIGNMSSMTALVLNGNNLTGRIPSEIGLLKELQQLYLSSNMLQGHIPDEICSLAFLGNIYLSENNFSGSIPSCIGNLQRAQKLFLGFNSLTSSMPSSLWEIRGLLFLNVSNNMIQGQIPRDIGKLENFQGVDLSNNQLASVIPTEFGELKSLSYLSLSNNLLQGSIPESFGNLINLEILDLSLNNLSGRIPRSLGRLLYLREINLSYNSLEGEIPAGGIFTNSSPRSFYRNKDLCGVPSLEVPLCANNTGSRGSKLKTRVVKIVVPVIALVAVAIVLFSIWMLQMRKRVKLDNPEQPEIRDHRIISYREILHATGGFSDSNLLGIGGSGSVYRAVLHDETTVAVKVFNVSDEGTLRKRFDTECRVLKQLRHRNLVRVITTCSNDDNLRAIVLQYMPNGSLNDVLYKYGHKLDLIKRIEIMLDVAKAIEYLHHGYDFPVVHCDLKPDNVLLDEDMVAHVSDFGISKILAGNKSQTRTLGTLGYIAPEYGSEGTVSTMGDVYSYGIMLMEVLTRRRPTDELFNDNLHLRQWVKEAYPDSLREVIDTNLFHDKGESNRRDNGCIISLIELSLDCTEEVPGDRINMKDAVIRLSKIKERLLDTKGWKP